MEHQLFELEDQVEDLEIMDEEKDESFDLITRTSVEEDREREAEGVKIRLPKTKGYAIVKVLSGEEILASGWLPGRLQTVLGDLLSGGTRTKVKDGREAFTRLRKLASDELELADAMVVHGFIKPQVVATEKDLDPDREDQIVVTRLNAADRRAYMRMVMNDRTEDVEILEPFR